jgi:hypothetical protein
MVTVLSLVKGLQIKSSPKKLKAPPGHMRSSSHMLSDSNPISKPWKNIKSTRAVLSYWILVYFIIFLGIAGGAFQCHWTYTHVPLEKHPLCIVLDENFDNEDAVFGNMGGFLCKLFQPVLLLFSPVFQTIYSHSPSNGEFEMTTTSVNNLNSFIQNGMLYIVPISYPPIDTFII